MIYPRLTKSKNALIPWEWVKLNKNQFTNCFSTKASLCSSNSYSTIQFNLYLNQYLWRRAKTHIQMTLQDSWSKSCTLWTLFTMVLTLSSTWSKLDSVYQKVYSTTTWLKSTFTLFKTHTTSTKLSSKS
jgi:hypothetical protein